MTRDVSRRLLRRRFGSDRGSTLVEAAIVTPLLLLLTFSIVDFSTMFYVYLSLENGVSQATRYGVTGNLMDDPNKAGSKLSREESIKLAMRQAASTLTLDDSAFTFFHRAPTGSAWLGGTGGPGDIEKVEVGYTFKFFDPLLWTFFDKGQISLTVDSAMKNEGKFE
jgi:TadE-like protein